jgi:hypothetical protein
MRYSNALAAATAGVNLKALLLTQPFHADSMATGG